MSTLLLKLNGSPFWNQTIFPPYLFVYEDILLYKKRHLLSVDEITTAYSHIVQVHLKRGIFFSQIEVINKDASAISIRWVGKEVAQRAKKLIDQKIYYAHAKERPDSITHIQGEGVHNAEKSINRLRELVNKGVISEKEFNEKRKKILKDMG